MQKKVFAVLMSLALVFTLLIQQLPTNVEAKATSDPIVNISQEMLTKATEEDCECSSGESNDKNCEEMNVFQDEKVLNTLKNQLNSLDFQGVSYYKANDFKWNETTLTKYNDEQNT